MQIARVKRKKKEGMTNYSWSTYHIHPFRKEEHCLLTLLSKYVQLVRLCVPENEMGGADWSMQIRKRDGGLKKDFLLGHKIMFNGDTKVSSGLYIYLDIPSVACTLAIQRGSDGVDRLLFDFEFFFPSEPHLLRQSHSQVQRERAGGVLGEESSWLRLRN